MDGSDTSTLGACLALFTGYTGSSIDSFLVEPYVAVAHIPASTEDEPNEDEDIFRQILILEGKRKRMIIFSVPAP